MGNHDNFFLICFILFPLVRRQSQDLRSLRLGQSFYNGGCNAKRTLDLYYTIILKKLRFLKELKRLRPKVEP